MLQPVTLSALPLLPMLHRLSRHKWQPMFQSQLGFPLQTCKVCVLPWGQCSVLASSWHDCELSDRLGTPAPENCWQDEAPFASISGYLLTGVTSSSANIQTSFSLWDSWKKQLLTRTSFLAVLNKGWWAGCPAGCFEQEQQMSCHLS